MFFKIDALKNLVIFTAKQLCLPVLQSLFDKAAGFSAYNFIKKRLQHSCFPVKFAKFLRTCFYRTPPVAASEVKLLCRSNNNCFCFANII